MEDSLHIISHNNTTNVAYEWVDNMCSLCRLLYHNTEWLARKSWQKSSTLTNIYVIHSLSINLHSFIMHFRPILAAQCENAKLLCHCPPRDFAALPRFINCIPHHRLFQSTSSKMTPFCLSCRDPLCLPLPDKLPLCLCDSTFLFCDRQIDKRLSKSVCNL